MDTRDPLRALDPFGAAASLIHASTAWWSHPKESLEQATTAMRDASGIPLHMLRRMMGDADPDPIPVNADDRRFADPVWTQEPAWDLLKEIYLWYTHATENAIYAAPGIPEAERERAAFWWRQWLNAIAPTNQLLTNPVALRKTFESGGANLVRGWHEMMQDWAAGTVRMTSPEDFTVGVNVAATPGKVVFRNRLLELIHYAPTAAKVHAMPIVIVTPWINKYYILDLDARKSMVRWLVAQGFDVYITSWKNPGPEMAEVAFDDYLRDGVDAAIGVARRISKQPQVHAVGYCLGGTLLATYMAWANAKYGAARVPVAHWTLFTTLVDFRKPGEIAVFLNEESVTYIEEQMRGKGYLDGSQMAASFRLLRSNSLIWEYVVHGWLQGERPAASDVLYWNMDTTRMPYRMHSWYLRELYLRNKLAQPGALTIAGEKIDLGSITQPLYAVSAVDDHIAPWREVFRVHSLVRGERRFALSSAGHVLGIVNPPVEPPRRHYWVGGAEAGGEGEAWKQSAEKRDGTWWQDWAQWLGGRCGKPRPAKATRYEETPGLAPAPGTYVKEH